MKNLFLLTLSIFTLFSCEKDSENLPTPYYSIEGKWLIEGMIPEEIQCISMKMGYVTLITV